MYVATKFCLRFSLIFAQELKGEVRRKIVVLRKKIEFCENRFCLWRFVTDLTSKVFIRHFWVSKMHMITIVCAHKSGVIFSCFTNSFQRKKKNMELRPKMTKIAPFICRCCVSICPFVDVWCRETFSIKVWLCDPAGRNSQTTCIIGSAEAGFL